MIASRGRGLGRGHGNITPALSRKKHRYTSKVPSAGEGVDRGEIKNLCLIQDYMIFGTQQAMLELTSIHQKKTGYTANKSSTNFTQKKSFLPV